MGKRIVGNLDCELSFAGRGATLPAAVLQKISAAATQLAVFADAGDTLWTPAPVAADLPDIALETGPFEALPPANEILAWGETAEVARERRRNALPPGPTTPEAAARANDKRFASELRASLGIALPGERIVRSIEELARAVADRPGPWVIKAPFAAAGRSRLAGEALDDAALRRARRLLAAHGELVFEPWLDREADFGCVGGGRIHRLEVTADGNFRAIHCLPADALGLSAEERRLILERWELAAGALAAIGYRGPLGVDAIRYRDARGRLTLHVPNDVNARLTFGHLAWARLQLSSAALSSAP